MVCFIWSFPDSDVLPKCAGSPSRERHRTIAIGHGEANLSRDDRSPDSLSSAEAWRNFAQRRIGRRIARHAVCRLPVNRKEVMPTEETRIG
jgi:hypothetical protein